VQRIACDAALTPMLVDEGDEPLDFGRTMRTASPPLRRAVVLSDKHCCFPGCDRPADWCDVHHLDDWAHGGRTRKADLGLVCRPHHRLLHEGRWRLQRGGGGEIGYWGAPWSRGRGVMTAAVRLLAVWAIDEFDLRRVELVIDVENAASCRVAERVGFMHEGVLRQYSAAKGIWRDQAVYSVLPGELEPGLRPQM